MGWTQVSGSAQSGSTLGSTTSSSIARPQPARATGKRTLWGATAGVKLSLPSKSIVRPFVKGGVTFHDLEGGYGGSQSNSLSTEKTPGYEIGLGADINLLGVFSFTPQARYVGQQLKAKIPGVNTPAADEPA